MSTKTSIKRIALVAVSALGFGLLSVMPAKADASNVAAASGSTTVVRTDITNDTAELTIEANGAIAAGSTLTLGSFTRNSLSLGSQVPTGFTWDWTDANTSAIGQAHGGTEAGASAGSALGHKTSGGAAAALASGDDVVVVTIANTAAQGTYTFTLDSSETDETAVTFTVYVAGAPAAVEFDAASYTAVASTNAAATLTVKDSGGNRSYLNSGEALQITSSSTSATTSVVLVDSGNYTKAVASAGGLSTNLTSATAGTYTFTAASAVNTLTVTSDSATLTVSTAPTNAETVTAVAGQLVIGHETSDNTDDQVVATAASEEDLSLFLDVSQLSLALTIAEADDTTAGSFEVAISQTSGVPFPGGVSAVTSALVPATLDADATGSSATYTVTATSALAGTGYTVTVQGATDMVIKVLYQAKQAYDIDLVDANATTIAAVELATSSQSVIVKDQFGVAMSGATVTYTTSGRNTVAVKTAVTGADGKVTISTTDAAATTSTSDDTLTANIASGDIPGAGTQDTSAATTIKYYDNAAGITPSAVALTVTQPGTPGTTATYDTARASTATISVTADTNLDNSASDQVKIADQIAISANVKNATPANIHGVAVSVSVTTGAYVLCSGTLGDVPVGSQTGAATTCSSYTDSSGNYAFQVGFTKAGTATVTVTSGSVTTTRNVTVVAANKAIVSAAASGSVVTATVTDLWGNAVSGAQVTFTAASGALLGGNFASLTSNTGADGTTSATVTTSTTGSYVITAAISGGDSAVAADTTNGVPAGVASATATVTVAASTAKTNDEVYAQAADAEAEAAKATTAAGEAKTEAAAATTAATTAGTKADAAKDEAAKATAAADAAKAEAALATAAGKAAETEAAKATAAATANAAELAKVIKALTDLTALVTKNGTDIATAGSSSTDAYDASLEAIDAANAATDAANLAQESADAATVAAEEARDAADAATAAVEELATQMSTLFASLKAQITTLGNTVAKIAKKVRA